MFAVPGASGVKVKRPADEMAVFLGITDFSFLQFLLLNGHGSTPRPNFIVSLFSSVAMT